jgi:hypothetical protein
MVGGGGAQDRGGGGRDDRGVGGAARVLYYCAQGRKNSGGHGAGRSRKVISARTWPLTGLPAVYVERFIEVAQIWKDAADRRKAFDNNTSCSANGEGTAAAVVVISSDEEE